MVPLLCLANSTFISINQAALVVYRGTVRTLLCYAKTIMMLSNSQLHTVPV